MDNINKENNKNYNLYDLEMRRMDREDEDKKKRQAFYKKNKFKIICLILAILTLFCLFNFGFFRTLGIWVVIIIGYSIGAYFDRDIAYINFLKNLLR